MAHKKAQKSGSQGTSPIQSVINLYDQALSSLVLAKCALGEKDEALASGCLNRAERVIDALAACLNLEAETGRNLSTLYQYVLSEMELAAEHRDASRLDRAISVLADLRQTWLDLQSHIGGSSDKLAA